MVKNTTKDENNEDEPEEELGTTDALDEELGRLTQQIGEFEAKYKRALADYQNLEKRVAEQRIDLIQGANKDLLLRLLPVLDTLILAQQHASDKTIEVSVNHFLDILKSEGVTRIETVGKAFDPSLMEGIATVEGDEGKVINEARAGFMLHDKLLRAAQVTVGSAKQN
jgi:molecular chaperone GrpE